MNCRAAHEKFQINKKRKSLFMCFNLIVFLESYKKCLEVFTIVNYSRFSWK